MDKKAFESAYLNELSRLKGEKSTARRNVQSMMRAQQAQQAQQQMQAKHQDKEHFSSQSPQQNYQIPQLQLGEVSGLGGHRREPQHYQQQHQYNPNIQHQPLPQNTPHQYNANAPTSQYQNNVGSGGSTIENFTTPGKILGQNETLNFNNAFFNPTVLRQEVGQEFKPKFRQYYEGILREEDRRKQIRVADNDLLKTNSFVGGTDLQGPLDKVDTTKDPFNTTDEENRYNKPEITPVNIDSSYRDVERYPNSNNIRILLPRIFQYVKEIRITSSEIPNTDRVVRGDSAEVRQSKSKIIMKCGEILNDANNHFYWINEEDKNEDYSCLIYDAEITPGNYVATACDCDETTIAEEIVEKVSGVNRFSNGRPHQFIVDVDQTTNIVRILSIESVLLENNPIITQVATNILQIKHTNHPFSVGDSATILGSTSVGGIPATTINATHTVENVIDENTYEVRVNTQAAFSEEGGGSNVTSGIEKPFKLLFSNLDTIGKILGFPQQDSSDPLSRDIEFITTNPIDLTKVDTSVDPPIFPDPEPSGSVPARIKTTDHCLIPGDEILVSDTDTIPDITGVQTVTKVINKDEFEIGVNIKVVNNQTVTTETRLGTIKRSLDEEANVVQRLDEQFAGCLGTPPDPHGLIAGDNIFIGNIVGGVLKNGDSLSGFHVVTEDFIDTAGSNSTNFLIESEILYEGDTSNTEPFFIRTGSTELNKITSIVPANNGRICPPFIDDPCCAVELSRLYTGEEVPQFILFRETDTDPDINGRIDVDVDAVFECGNTFVKCDPFWQSWTSHFTGNLVGIYIRTGDAEIDTTSQIRIYEGVGTGGTLLGESDFSDVSRDVSVGTYFCTNLHIEEGVEYTWEMQFFTDISGMLVCGNEGNLYTEGESDLGGDIDYEFRTFISAGLKRVDYYSQTTGKFDLTTCICEVFNQNPNQSYLRSLDSELRCIKDAFTFSEGLWRFATAHGCLPGDRFYARLLGPEPLNTTQPYIVPNVLGIQTVHDVFNSLDLDTLTLITESTYRDSPITGNIEIVKTLDLAPTKIQNIYPQSTSGYYAKDNTTCDPNRTQCVLCECDFIVIRKEEGNLDINKETDVVQCDIMSNVYGCYKIKSIYSDVSTLCDDIFDLNISGKLALGPNGTVIGECARLDTDGGVNGQNGIFANSVVFFERLFRDVGGQGQIVQYQLRAVPGDPNSLGQYPGGYIPSRLIGSPSLFSLGISCTTAMFTQGILDRYFVVDGGSGNGGPVVAFWFQIFDTFSGKWYIQNAFGMYIPITFAQSDTYGSTILTNAAAPELGFVTTYKVVTITVPNWSTGAWDAQIMLDEIVANAQLVSTGDVNNPVAFSVTYDLNQTPIACAEPTITFTNLLVGATNPMQNTGGNANWNVNLLLPGVNPTQTLTTNVAQDPPGLEALCVRTETPHLLTSGDAIYITTDPITANCNIGTGNVVANVLMQLDNSVQFIIPDETDARVFKIFGTPYMSGINNRITPEDPEEFENLISVNGPNNDEIQFFYHKICGASFNPIKQFFSNSQCGMIESLDHNVNGSDDIYIGKATVQPDINGYVPSGNIEIFDENIIMWRDESSCIETANVGQECAGEFIFPASNVVKSVFDITEANDGLIFADNEFQGGECLYFLNDVNINNNFTNDLRENFFTVSTTNLTGTQFQLEGVQIQDVAPLFGNTFNTFTSTAFFEPGSYEIVVPSGVSSYKVIMAGAGGGSWPAGVQGAVGDSIGGNGSLVEGSLSVSPGDVLTINVGSAGDSASPSAFGGEHGFGDFPETSITGFNGLSWPVITEVTVTSTGGFPSSGYFLYLDPSSTSSILVNYTGITPTSFTGCTTTAISSPTTTNSIAYLDDGHGGSHAGSQGLFAFCSNIIGTGGGASSDIRLNGTSVSDRVVVAGGGGGGGYWGSGAVSSAGPFNGGDGGGLIGGSGQGFGAPSGGTQVAAGSGAYPGALSNGGGNNLLPQRRGVCGGGGGYFGGGGGRFSRNLTIMIFPPSISCTEAESTSGAGGSDLLPSGFTSIQGGGAPADKDGFIILIPEEKITFNTPGTYLYRIPNDTNSLKIELMGAGGESGNSARPDSLGGTGGRTVADINLTNIIQPGDIIQLNVGGTGLNKVGGFNGGGDGASENAGVVPIAGGGGGGTDMRISPFDLSDRILVAGGGGGGVYIPPSPCFIGGASNIGKIGGNGGDLNGTNGQASNDGILGQRGTQVGAGTSSGGVTTGDFGSGGNGALGGGPNNKASGGGGGGWFGGGGGTSIECAIASGGGGSGFLENDPTIILPGTGFMETGNGSPTDANGVVCITLTRSNDGKFGMGHFIQVPCGDSFNAIELIERKTNGVFCSEIATGFPVVQGSNACVYDNSNSDVCVLITDGVYDDTDDIAKLKDVIAMPVPFPTPAPVFSQTKFETEIVITPEDIEFGGFPLGNNKVDEISTDDTRFPGLNGLSWISDLGCEKVPLTKILRDSTGSIFRPVLDPVTKKSLLNIGDSVFFISNHATVPDLNGLHQVRYVDLGNTVPEFFELEDIAIIDNGGFGPANVANADVVYFRSPVPFGGNTDGCITINSITEGNCPTIIRATNHGFPVTIPETKINVVILDTQTNPPIDFANVGIITCAVAIDEDNIRLPEEIANIRGNGNVELCPLEVVNLENLLIVQKGRWSKEILSTNCGVPILTPDEANARTIVTTNSRVNLKSKVIFELGNSIPDIGGTEIVEVILPAGVPKIPFRNGEEVLISGHIGGNPPIDGIYKIFAVTPTTFKIQNNTTPGSYGGFGGFVTGDAPPSVPGHGLCDGYQVKFMNVMSEPDINDKIYDVTVIDENNFAIPVELDEVNNNCPGRWCTNTINLELKDHGFANGDIFFLYGAKALGGILEDDLNTRHGNKIQNRLTTEERLTRKIAKVIDDTNIQFQALDFPLSRTLGGGFDVCISAHNHDEDGCNIGLKNYGFSAIQTNLNCNGDLNRFIDLDPEPYIFLTSERLRNLATTGTLVDNIFAKIQLSEKPGEVLYNTFISDDLIFDNPLRKLDEIDFQFFRRDGKPFDFLGMDWAITIEITEYKDRILGTNMQSGRGPIPDRGSVSQQGFVETTISSANPQQNVVNPAAFLQSTDLTQRVNAP